MSSESPTAIGPSVNLTDTSLDLVFIILAESFVGCIVAAIWFTRTSVELLDWTN
jgi:hypothetical protein